MSSPIQFDPQSTWCVYVRHRRLFFFFVFPFFSRKFRVNGKYLICELYMCIWCTLYFYHNTCDDHRNIWWISITVWNACANIMLCVCLKWKLFRIFHIDFLALVQFHRFVSQRIQLICHLIWYNIKKNSFDYSLKCALFSWWCFFFFHTTVYPDISRVNSHSQIEGEQNHIAINI